MTLSEYIETSLTKAAERIKGNLDAAGENASGRTKASIRVTRTDKGFALVGGGEGCAPLGTLEIGRKAGKVPIGFEHILLQWAHDKGITIDGDEMRFARSLKWKIARMGTMRHYDTSARKDIYSSVAAETLGDIRSYVGNYTSATIRDYIRKLNF